MLNRRKVEKKKSIAWIECDLESNASAFSDRTWLDGQRRKFINKLREPIIILSNSVAGVELINHDKVTRKQDHERESAK